LRHPPLLPDEAGSAVVACSISVSVVVLIPISFPLPFLVFFFYLMQINN
jgi:hypothetical protein